jgi:hypothetical protein
MKDSPEKYDKPQNHQTRIDLGENIFPPLAA